MKRNSWKEYFVFSAKERNAIIILLMVMGAFIVLPFLFSPKERNIIPDKKLQEQIAQLQKADSSESVDNAGESEDVISSPAQSKNSFQPKIKSDSLFYFDPNTTDENGLRSLGLTEKNIHTIINYRSKGGKFFKPNDLAKIYGISKSKVDELIPFIQIKNQNKNVAQNDFVKKDSVPQNHFEKFPEKKYSIININSATAADFKSLPGIGDVLSNRIIKFRDKIGGFKTVEDVKKTYGLSDSVFQNIKPYLELN